MGEKINVKEILKRKKEELKAEVDRIKNLGITPKLAVILASEDPASQIYVGKKRKCAKRWAFFKKNIFLTKTFLQKI